MENMQYRKLWFALTAVMVLSLGVLGYYGWELYQVAPPVTQRVVTATGKVVFTGAQIRDGQNAWQSIGGQEVGSVWGHGAYVAQTGLLIGCVASWSGYSTNGPARSSRGRSMPN